AAMPEADRQVYDAFVRKVADLRRAFSATNSIRSEMNGKLKGMQTAILDMPADAQPHLATAYRLQQELNQLGIRMNGDYSLARREFETPPTIGDRIGRCEYGMWDVTSEPTQVYQDAYRLAADEFGDVLATLKRIAEEIGALEKQLEMNDAPFTPGRWPEWKR
ncbi:MAG: glycosyl hydrolase, partial [Saprospiraceae bacterium]